MLSKSQIKLIKSLSQKKFRNKHGLFVVEGLKGVGEFLDSDYELVSLYTTKEDFGLTEHRYELIEEKDLKRISFLTSSQQVLAVFRIPSLLALEIDGLTVALDGLRDPGNLGTIIRLCDWFGVEKLICSKDTVDCYNPKVVQASMGSLARIDVQYVDLPVFLKKVEKTTIFGTMLDGENLYQEDLPENAIIILGNEANGITPEVENLLNRRISIPQFGKIQATESLNVATAASIVLSEFRRNSIEK